MYLKYYEAQNYLISFTLYMNYPYRHKNIRRYRRNIHYNKDNTCKSEKSPRSDVIFMVKHCLFLLIRLA